MKQKNHFNVGMIVILLVIGVFSLGLFTENKDDVVTNEITGAFSGLESVTGMATPPPIKAEDKTAYKFTSEKGKDYLELPLQVDGSVIPKTEVPKLFYDLAKAKGSIVYLESQPNSNGELKISTADKTTYTLKNPNNGAGTITASKPGTLYYNKETKQVINSDEVSADRKKELDKKESGWGTISNVFTRESYTEIDNNGKVVKVVETTAVYKPTTEGKFDVEITRTDSKTGTVIYFKQNQERDKLNEIKPDEKGDFPGTIKVEKMGLWESSVCSPGPCPSDIQTKISQYKTRSALFAFEQAAQTAQGFGGYSKLFLPKETLDAWRESVDKTFATLYLGTQYWESAVCSTYIDRDNEGVAYIDTPGGLASVAAHIEASRTVPIILPPGVESGDAASGFTNESQGSQGPDAHGIVRPRVEYLYKITYNVRNGRYTTDPQALQTMRFNVYLKGEREVPLYSTKIEIKKGSAFGASGQSAIVQYSNYRYDKICIRFDNVPSAWSLSGNELCNMIVASTGSATSINAAQPSGSPQAGAGSSGTSLTVNDI